VSNPAASYTFLPWLRRGIAAAGRAEGNGRLTVPLTVSFGPGREAGVSLKLAGPGELNGLDARSVIRTWPAANVRDAEPNFFPMAEFDQPDLPWRYTPIGSASNGRLQPWLCLIALKDDEISNLVSPTGTRPLPVVQVAGAPLPRLDQAWAWAHTQAAGTDALAPDDTESLLATAPHLLVSRLLCPRCLDPSTRYTALLVPTFEAGVRAGAGRSLEGLADLLAPAWPADQPRHTLELPFYFRWSFTTGILGDFEELVKRLKAHELPATVGIQPMDVSDPGAHVPAASHAPLGFEGALRSPRTQSTDWQTTEREPFADTLAAVVNRPADLLESEDLTPAVAPPLYGRWHAAKDRLEPGEQPPWFHDANSDPRWRGAAGLGTQVVQANQQQLMASAWQQVDGLSDLNDSLQRAQFAREIALRIKTRHLDLNDDLFLQVTAPVHTRVLASPTTIAARLRESPVAQGSVGAQWRRIARPLGAVGRRQARPRGERPQAVARMNRDELAAARPPKTPEQMATASRVGQTLVPASTDPATLERLRRLSRRRRSETDLGRRVAIRDGVLAGTAISAQPARPRFVAVESSLLTGGAPAAQPLPPASGNADSKSARAFRTAATAILDATPDAFAPAEPLRSVSLAAIRQKLTAELDPHKTIAARFHGRLQLDGRVAWSPIDPLEPGRTGPEFPQPLYRYLAELSPDWLVPGLQQVPANTASLALTNQRFVEAFMLGANHEMGRELLWREYPANQRDTWFRQFWDPSGFVPQGGQPLDALKLKDIRPLHEWTGELGDHGSRDAATSDQLVLFIRGDVVHRYPNLVVYVARAVIDPQTGLREPGTEEVQPVFGGTLPPDVAFFGFPLSEEAIRGSASDLGWFFVLQEQPTEPRFGLDVAQADTTPPSEWNALHWGHLAAPGQPLEAIDYINLNTQFPDTSSVTDATSAAWHAESGLGPSGSDGAQIGYITLQRPVRVAIHSADLLPKKPA
jgi:hypothetical protein